MARKAKAIKVAEVVAKLSQLSQPAIPVGTTEDELKAMIAKAEMAQRELTARELQKKREANRMEIGKCFYISRGEPGRYGLARVVGVAENGDGWEVVVYWVENIPKRAHQTPRLCLDIRWEVWYNLRHHSEVNEAKYGMELERLRQMVGKWLDSGVGVRVGVGV